MRNYRKIFFATFNDATSNKTFTHAMDTQTQILIDLLIKSYLHELINFCFEI